MSISFDNRKQKFTYADGDQGDSLVDSSQRRDINSLTSDCSLGTDTGRVFTRSSVDDGINKNLNWVLVGKQVDDFESMSDDSDGHLLSMVLSMTFFDIAGSATHLLSVISSVHHQAVNESLNDWHLRFPELLGSISTSGVR